MVSSQVVVNLEGVEINEKQMVVDPIEAITNLIVCKSSGNINKNKRTPAFIVNHLTIITQMTKW